MATDILRASTAARAVIVILAAVRKRGSERVDPVDVTDDEVVDVTDAVVDVTDAAVAMLGAPVHAQVLAHLRDAVMLVDAEGVVSYASPNSATVLGHPPQHFIGSLLSERLGAPDTGAIERALSRPADADPDLGSLLFGGAAGPLILFVDHPTRLGPPGTRLLTFRPAGVDDDPAGSGGLVESVSASVPESLDVEAVDRLARAIVDDELTVHYQPEIDLETGLPLGAEALVRWMHPERGEICAGDFVEMAEAAGLINEIGRFVIRRACADFGSWARRFAGTVLTLRVNLSAEQLGNDDLVEVIAAALADSGLDPSSLCVEVTETALMSDPSSFDTLHELRDMGIEVAIDDFGTGFSSLSQLKRLPVDVLKIDRSFVAGLGHSTEDTAITRSVIELARALGLAVVAEGIEHPRQLDELLRLGCRRGQGWLYSRAVPWTTLEAQLLHD